MAYQAFIILAVAASASSQSYQSYAPSAPLIYGNSAADPPSGSSLPSYTSTSYSSLSSPSAFSSSSGSYAPSAPLLAQFPSTSHGGNSLFGANLHQPAYPSQGYDVTEAPQEPEAPPSPIPPPSPPAALPPPPNPPQQLPPQQPLPDIYSGTFSAPGQDQFPQALPGFLPGSPPSGGSDQPTSVSSTSFSSPYVSYQH